MRMVGWAVAFVVSLPLAVLFVVVRVAWELADDFLASAPE